MSSAIGSMNNVKIFVLYLMRNINYPLDYVAIGEIVMQTDYIMYLDFAEAFQQMLEANLIHEVGKDERDNPLYEVTSRGKIVAEQLKSDIIPKILDESMAVALRYLDFKRRNVTIDSTASPLGDQTVNTTLTMRENGKQILSLTLNTDSSYRDLQIRRNFHDRPDVIYRGLIALLCGKMDYLFDKK